MLRFPQKRAHQFLSATQKKEGKTMKLIKTTNTRTSQACDRCRIKKIKCDGLLPACSNCLKIGYNCQISDKLTRRAFPRGYTENLEKNMIALEKEMSDLKQELEKYKASSGNFQRDDNLSQNFFKFNNHIQDDLYLGLNSLQVKFNQLLTLNGINSNIQESKSPSDGLELQLHDFLLTKFLTNFPSKHNLDLILQQFFVKFNKVLPIINEDMFLKQYRTLNFQNLSSTNTSFLIQLILIIQLNCSIFSIHDIHNLIINSSSLQVLSPSLTNFENLLLSLWLFHNKNCYQSSVISISNILKSMVLNLGLHLNYNNLENSRQESKDEKYNQYSHRLRLYWCYHILSKVTSFFNGISDVNFFKDFHVPKIVDQELSGMLKLLEFLDFKDWNILDQQDTETIQFVKQWTQSLDESQGVVNLQLSFFANVFKISLGIDIIESSRSYLVALSKLHDTKELGLNSFEFHLIPVNFVKIAIIAMLNLINDPSPPSFDKVINDVLKNRYPENYLLFQDILNFILSKNEPVTSPASSSISTPASSINSYQSLFKPTITTTTNSTSTNNSTTNNSSASNSRRSLPSLEPDLRNNSIVSTHTEIAQPDIETDIQLPIQLASVDQLKYYNPVNNSWDNKIKIEGMEGMDLHIEGLTHI